MTAAWSDTAIAGLESSPGCPVCGEERVADGWCRACGSDFRGGVGSELWEASLRAASALRTRQDLLVRVPRMTVDLSPVPYAPPLRPARAATPRPAGTGSSATVQSVLAVAGAGTVAVAALVFTFFNPDLQDRGVRSVVVSVVSALFLAGAWLLARRGLRMSAEAVGALGLVFIALAVASTTGGTDPRAAWTGAATATLLLAPTMLALGAWARLRSWLAVALLALATVPLLYALSAGSTRALTIGALLTAFGAYALVPTLPRFTARFASTLVGERVALTALQAIAAATAVVAAALTVAATPAYWLGNAVVLAAVAALGLVSVRRPAGAVWALTAGVAGVLAFVAMPAAGGDVILPGRWFLALLPAAAAAGVIALTAASARLPRLARVTLTTGALVVLAMIVGRTVVAGLLVGAAALLGAPATDGDLLATDAVAAIVLGLLATAAGLALAVVLDRRLAPRPTFGAAWVAAVSTWFAVAGALVALASPSMLADVRVGASLLAAAAVSLVVRSGRGRAVPLAHRIPLAVGAHAAIVLAGVASIRADTALLVVGGAGTVGALLVVSTTVPAAGRFVHAGAAWAYGLLVMAMLLGRAEVAPLPLLCVVAVVAGAGAIVATFTRVPARSWWAILAVTAIPFGLGILQVVFERSGWTALSTAVLFALALTLTITRRPGLGAALRALAAGTMLPALAVVTVCLGAQLLATSGSPVVLPVIAALVALTLAARRRISTASAHRLGGPTGAFVSLAIEASALVTGAIAVALAIVREAAGAGPTLLVLVILAAGTAALARWGGRPYGWWLAGVTSTGALWSVWVLVGVDSAEAFLLPPAVGAALIGAALAARGRGPALYTGGLAAAIAPILALLIATGSPGGDAARAYGLVTAAATLAAAGILLRRAGSGLRSLSTPTLVAAIVAGSAGAVQGVRWGVGLDAAPTGTLPLVALCLGLGAAGGLAAAVSGWALRPNGTWRRTALIPAVVCVPLSVWTAMDSEWSSIWIMWSLMAALLLAMVGVAITARPTTVAPPVPVLFALAFVTAVVAWSPRELRVEWFSLPLGILLMVAGAVGLRADVAERPAWRDWPRTGHGSWTTFGPGLLVVFGASVSATYTDPQTWRAILVIAVALAAILAGAALRLAAPFLLGIIVLPVENALAFVVQIGRGIESMPWWITLSVVGAVLLIIAVTYERRSDAGFVARLRDLR